MKRFANLNLVAAVVLLLAMMSSIRGTLAQSGNNYAYLTISDDPTLNLRIISADNPTTAGIGRQYPLPTGWSLTRQVFLSPDGVWIAAALISDDQQRGMIQLYNAHSGETREVAQGALSTNGRNIVWSPNGHYLALNIAQNTTNFGTIIYSVADGKVANLTNDNADHYDIGWSPDSTHLVTFTKVCSDNRTNCMGKVDLFDVTNSVHEASVDLSIPFGNSIACGFTISPDIQYVAFVARCSSQPEVATDVYLWDVKGASVTQVTDLFTAEPNKAPIQASYNFAWLGAQTVLIGTQYQLFSQPEMNQLIRYDVSQAATTSLSTSAGTSFALNPTSDQIAIRLNTAGSQVSSLERQDQIAILPIDDLEQNANPLSAVAVSTAMSIPSGCGLQWSSNGGFLSYNRYTEGDCQGDITSFVFVDITNKTVSEHSVSLDGISTGGVIIPLGWIAG